MTSTSAAFLRDQLGRGVSPETLRRRLGLAAGDIPALLAQRRGPDILVRGIADRRHAAPDPLELEEAAVAVERIAAAVAGVYLIDPRLVFGSPVGTRARWTTFGLVTETRRHLSLDAIAKVSTFNGPATVQRGVTLCAELRKVDAQFACRYDRSFARLQEP